MARWIQICFLVLVGATTASPLLAQSDRQFTQFPRTLREAIDPGARSSARPESSSSQPRKSISPFRMQTYRSNRKTPAQSVSVTRWGKSAKTKTNQPSEFGTVMTFPAAASKPTTGVFRRPRKPNTTLAPSIGLAGKETGNPFQGETVLSATVTGPPYLVNRVPQAFEIVVSNPSSETVNDIIVQLQAPDGITVSRLDRNAWLDEQNRTVSWRVNRLPSGFETKIRYYAMSETPGTHTQKITLGMRGTFQGEAFFDTNLGPDDAALAEETNAQSNQNNK